MTCRTTRRDLIMGGGLATLASAINILRSQAKGPRAAALSAAERANIKFVREFFASWNRPQLDIDQLMAQYMAPNASVRWLDSEPPAIGPAAAAAAAKKGAGDHFRVAINVLEVFARGPLVATSRIDTVKVPGKPDEIFEAVGVCIVKDGQFREYCDYVVT
jgi:limonene-1,2-epoxide hydrolase